VGECEHRRVIPYPTPNTWAVPKRWLICTKDNIWSNLPEEPAHSRPSSHPNTCRRLGSSRSTWCSTLGTVFTLCRDPSRTDRSTSVSMAAGREVPDRHHPSGLHEPGAGSSHAPVSASGLLFVSCGYYHIHRRVREGAHVASRGASIRAQERNGQILSIQSSRLSQARNTDPVRRNRCGNVRSVLPSGSIRRGGLHLDEKSDGDYYCSVMWAH